MGIHKQPILKTEALMWIKKIWIKMLTIKLKPTKSFYLPFINAVFSRFDSVGLTAPFIKMMKDFDLGVDESGSCTSQNKFPLT